MKRIISRSINIIDCFINLKINFPGLKKLTIEPTPVHLEHLDVS